MVSARDLTSLGLSDKESQTYLTLLRLGEAGVQDLADAAGIKRPTAYLIVSTLQERGLIATARRGKKTVYLASHPRILEELVRTEETRLTSLSEGLRHILPELEALYNEGGDRRPAIKYYEGFEGQAAMREEAGQDGESEIYSFVSLDDLQAAFPRYNPTHEKTRIQHGTFSHVIYTDAGGPRLDDSNDLLERRYIPKNLYPFSGSLTIHPKCGKLYISIYKEYSIGIVIESRMIADMALCMWRLAWDAAGHLTKDRSALPTAPPR